MGVCFVNLYETIIIYFVNPFGDYSGSTEITHLKKRKKKKERKVK